MCKLKDVNWDEIPSKIKIYVIKTDVLFKILFTFKMQKGLRKASHFLSFVLFKIKI